MKAYVVVCRNGDTMWVDDKTFTTIDEAAVYACCSISSPVLWKACPIKVDISNEMNISDTLLGKNKDVLIEILYDPIDYAVKNMKCTYLSVDKSNKLAKMIYDEYGLRVYQEDKKMYYMTLDKNPVKS